MSDTHTHVVKRVMFNKTLFPDPLYMRLHEEDGAPIWNVRKVSAVPFTFREACLWIAVLRQTPQHYEQCSYAIEAI